MPQEQPWPRQEPASLAHYVTEQATRWLAIGESRYDLSQAHDGRRRLAEALYLALSNKDIRYDLEGYHPSDQVQPIRTPAEVLEAPRQGTCLDLAALFCGLCLGNELLALLIVLDGHALAAVSLTHGLRDWDGYRPERNWFENGPLTDPVELRGRIDRGEMLAIECTGFARSERLAQAGKDAYPESIGRSADGRLSFARAVEAGCEQLDERRRPFTFALDIALAHYRWLIKPYEDPVQATLAKAYDVVGAEAAAASNRIFEAATSQPFYGRAGDIKALDDALERERGILLVRGEAGLGKSRLASRWAETCAQDRRNKTLRHAFSVRERAAAGDRAAMVANLVRQAADLLGPWALGEGEPGDRQRLEDRLVRLLQADRPAGERLVVVLDGLDEAAEPIEPWRTRLGRGVFILATCRAEAGEEPQVLRIWREHATELDILALQYVLAPLDAQAIATWLSAATGQKIEETDALVLRAMQASEGVPLFAGYLIPDAIEALRAGANDPFPASFGDYARQRLRELRDRLVQSPASRWSWGEVLTLFALLSVAKAPLPPVAVSELVAAHQLDELDQRAERWLWRRTERGGAVGFAHPRLAAVFRGALAHFDPGIVVKTEKRLVKASFEAWGEVDDNLLSAYALTWLPDHLVGLNRWSEAADLLGDGAFLLARLSASPTAATVRATASETIALAPRLAETHPASHWRRFWSETEGRVESAMDRAETLGVTPQGILAQLAHDRFGAGTPLLQPLEGALLERSPPRMRLMQPCGFVHPALLRSLDKAHAGGVLALPDRLVSWGNDGALRFWSLAGEPRPGGDPRAHAGPVRGVLALPDRLVSWGGDGALRFWSLAGEPRPGGDPKAHAGAVEGVLALPGRLVSWGNDGALRFWSLAGEPRPGGDPKAHAGMFGVRGVLALPDRLVSWGNDGALRFWSLAGEPRPGGDPKAHAAWVQGVLALPDRLVSWGEDGALRFWSLAGEPRPGGDPNAHAGPVRGVLALPDRLVSWGNDGALRFWSLAGEPRPGGDPKAHAGAVWGVLTLPDRLVSWGNDGALRFWSLAGEPLSGGDPRAHAGAVWGVLALPDRLVSWGNDGALRFWSLAGEPRPGGDPKAHAGAVWGVLTLPDRLVSWGGDGALRFWSLAGEPRPGGDPNAHAGPVEGVLALPGRLVSWGNDGALRFWSLAGEPRPGGDPKAHAGWVLGVLALPDRLVSWGNDEALRFWSLAGEPRPGGDPNAHAGWVRGVLALPDRLVSWGGDGALRFWSLAGEPRPGGDPNAHAGPVWGVLALPDRLVSGGEDGALRFWSLAGEPRPGGDPNAHAGWVQGVLALPDRLVSWGNDEALRFWSLAGEPRPGGDPNAHAGLVRGVLALPDRLVSWGGDGALRFWSLAGEPRPGGDPNAHAGPVGGVLALPDRLVSWGGDGALRFWSLAGEPRPGGDPKAHAGWVQGVLALPDRLVSWDDYFIRLWGLDGMSTGSAWVAPAPLDMVDLIDHHLWVGLLGRPHRLLIEQTPRSQLKLGMQAAENLILQHRPQQPVDDVSFVIRRDRR